MSKVAATLSLKGARSFKIDPKSQPESSPPQTSKMVEARVDGRKVVLHADCEILIECGASSIMLRKDGKIILKGTEIVSRASGRHKIRGASIEIN